jgi:7-cyano-7-deazaguanine synthase in queuosine biosynthesis
MAANQGYAARALPVLHVDIVEEGGNAKRGWTRCALGDHIAFKADRLNSYFFAPWNLTVHDALLVAAAAEFCDRTRRRPSNGWGREFNLHIPVHEPELWNSLPVSHALHDALRFVTGDRWDITFYARKKAEESSQQAFMDLGRPVSAVIPYSDGLDSRAVAGLMGKKLGDSLVRVCLGTAGAGRKRQRRSKEPFTAVPYSVKSPEHTPEPSARSRGFKFTLLGGLAAYLAKAETVFLPESGQGALGPTIVPVGQAYIDYRNHPLFMAKMETLLYSLLGHRVRFVFPQLWHTKGETLRMYMEECDIAPSHLADTRSCWQGNRQVSINRKTRQCGICAACMLRRMSLHAAGVTEPPDTYVWEELAAATLEAGASPEFSREKITPAMREYAIAGTLHMDHLAALRHSAVNSALIDLSTSQLGQALCLPQADVCARLDRLLMQHEKEWKEFMSSLGPTSFVAKWAIHGYDRAA